ncbi:MAG: hypothetical protein NXI04_22710 [Planctomycetaceae bacterium]|nr:hypothetical protein [Planctomycetaceae bacterium]
MEALEQIAIELDSKDASWDIWRTEDRHWCVKISMSQQTQTFKNGGLTKAMEAANNWKPLPLVPRQPRLLYESLFEPRKSGSKWELHYDGNYFGGGLKTKREALECAERLARKSQAAVNEWDVNYGWTAAKVEGVDFRYSSA